MLRPRCCAMFAPCRTGVRHHHLRPSALAIAAAPRPMGPAPTTNTCSPARIAARRTAWALMAKGSISAAAFRIDVIHHQQIF